MTDLIRRLRSCASGMGVRNPSDYTAGLTVADALEAADALEDLQFDVGIWEDEARGRMVEIGRLQSIIEQLYYLNGEAQQAEIERLEGVTKVTKKKHKWKCPINYEGCTKNCGDYGCGN